jgi:hypothetical protein
MQAADTAAAAVRCLCCMVPSIGQGGYGGGGECFSFLQPHYRTWVSRCVLDHLLAFFSEQTQFTSDGCDVKWSSRDGSTVPASTASFTDIHVQADSTCLVFYPCTTSSCTKALFTRVLSKLTATAAAACCLFCILGYQQQGGYGGGGYGGY